MARTKNGNYRGMAAVIDAADRRNKQWDLFSEEQEARHRFTVAYRWWLRKLKRLDPTWETWYDERPEQTMGEMLPLIIARVKLFEELAMDFDELLESNREKADLYLMGMGC